jgi:hypothetical protein
MNFSDSESFWLTIEDIEQHGGADSVLSESITKTDELEERLNTILRNGAQIGAGRKSSKKIENNSRSKKKGSKKGSKTLEGGSTKKANVKEMTMKRGSKKSSKKSSKKGSKKGSKQARALPEALLLFQELVKHVANGIGKAGRPAMTIAGQVKKDLLVEKPNLSGKEMINAAKKYFDDNKSKYMKML